MLATTIGCMLIGPLRHPDGNQYLWQEGNGRRAANDR